MAHHSGWKLSLGRWGAGCTMLRLPSSFLGPVFFGHAVSVDSIIFGRRFIFIFARFHFSVFLSGFIRAYLIRLSCPVVSD
jgi:hypothetical protein